MKNSSGGKTWPSLVILLTYGPRPVTRMAQRNLKNSLPGVPVHQVSAFGGTATPELEQILRGAEKQAVLVIHDDVAIHRRSIERLTTVALRGSAVAVPVSNDENCSHYIGVLPAGAQAKAALTNAESKGDPSVEPATTFRPACMVARAERMYKLLVQRIHDPLSVLTSTDDGVVVVRNAVAAHDLSCASQLRAFQTPRDQALLVASMIVKNEEALLGDCLESLSGVVDRIDLCDTGSNDQTIAIAQEAGANIIEREWRDDFAWARNEVLEESRDARWVLWIDADERLQTPDVGLLRAYLAAFDGELEAFEIEITNLSDGETNRASSRFRTVRLFRPDIAQFVGPLHEQVRHRSEKERKLVSMKLSLVGIDHLGYQAEVVGERGKQERNVEISREAYLESGDAKSAMDYARSLSLAEEQPELVLELLEESVLGLPEEDVSARSYVLGFLGRVLLLDHDQPLEAIDRALEALELVPTEDMSLAILAQAFDETGQYRELVEFHEDHSFAAIPRPVAVIEAARVKYHRYLAAAYLECGDAEAAWASVIAMVSIDSSYSTEDLTVIVEVARKRDHCESLTGIAECFEDTEDVDELVQIVAASSMLPITIAVCTEFLLAGIESSAAVTTGVLAAVLFEQPEIAQEIASYRGILDLAVAEKLSLRLEQRGHMELAATIKPDSATV